MKTLYFQCNMGAAGDMLTAALLELMPEPEKALTELNHLGLPGVVFSTEKVTKCGILGTHVTVTVEGEEEAPHDHHHYDHDSHDHHDHDHHDHDHHHHHDHVHTDLARIRQIVSALTVSDQVKNNILKVYESIAEAESYAHGVPVEQIHFHEVGAMDAIADVTAVCYLIEKLGAERITASPVAVGSGQVRCAHGILPVPAPATAYVLRGIPSYSGSVMGELCTPTGAALLRHYVQSYGDQPLMAVEKIGYGCGKKDFPVANCVRTMVGWEEKAPERVVELSCNLDDMTGEALGFAQEQLLAAGALDVYAQSIQMKKSRPGCMLNVLCHEADKEKLLRLIFRYTTTLGIREAAFRRYTMDRRVETISTELGSIRKKVASGYDVTREKFEYEDLARIAREKGMTLAQVLEKI